jgi:hypothetical protein
MYADVISEVTLTSELLEVEIKLAVQYVVRPNEQIEMRLQVDPEDTSDAPFYSGTGALKATGHSLKDMFTAEILKAMVIP